MALFTLTISNLSPALDRQNQEVQLIDRYLEHAAREVHSNQGKKTSGNILGDNNAIVSSWVYTPQAAS
jgi:hypothetical protein